MSTQKTRKRAAAKPPKVEKLPRLPKLLDRKIYKTGQTRGADDDEILRSSSLGSLGSFSTLAGLAVARLRVF